MPTKNQVILEGFLGAKPELRQTSTGVPVANARLATTFRRKDQGGNVIETTAWHSLVFYDGNAELAELFNQGDNIHAEGRLEYREFHPKDGAKRTVTEVVVFRCYRIDHRMFRRDSAPAASPEAGAGAQAPRDGGLDEWEDLAP